MAIILPKVPRTFNSSGLIVRNFPRLGFCRKLNPESYCVFLGGSGMISKAKTLSVLYEKYHNIVGLLPFESLVSKQTTKALGDPAVRGAWSGARFWNLYGSAEPWNVIYAAWFLQASEFAINSKIIEGVNHFLVWEDPEKAIRRDSIPQIFVWQQQGNYYVSLVFLVGNGVEMRLRLEISTSDSMILCGTLSEHYHVKIIIICATEVGVPTEIKVDP
ncbi:hypothetical protein B0H14DRAFT_2572805 [Mycena olivaceomarginata]|nr:hypothetical protein B0H14DRAFT_2572805 [Mycena olivaceomarginata]